MRSASVFLDALSEYLLEAARGMGWFGWGRRKQHLDKVSCGWGKGAGQVVQDQNPYALAVAVAEVEAEAEAVAVAEAEVLLVTQCLSEGMGVESEGRNGKDKRPEFDTRAQEEGRGSEGVSAGAVPATETLTDREAD